MENYNNNGSMMNGLVPSLIIAGGLVAAAFMVSPGLNRVGSNMEKMQVLAEKAVKNAAIDGCYQAARVTRVSSDEATIAIPETAWMNNCMKEKGYK
jgi:hypothetical protein